jgi:SH3 domain protein
MGVVTMVRSGKSTLGSGRLRGLLLLTGLFMAQAAAAQGTTRWITDQLEVDMRRGQSNRHAITRMVPTGTAVELIQADAASGYSRIRTPSGAEGWVLSRFLASQPPARVRATELEQKLAEVRAQSADALKIAEQNSELTSRLAAAEERAAGLEARNRELSDQGRRSWFIAGAAVLASGLALGLILPRIRWKKKSSWDRL